MFLDKLPRNQEHIGITAGVFQCVDGPENEATVLGSVSGGWHDSVDARAVDLGPASDSRGGEFYIGESASSRPYRASPLFRKLEWQLLFRGSSLGRDEEEFPRSRFSISLHLGESTRAIFLVLRTPLTSSRFWIFCKMSALPHLHRAFGGAVNLASDALKFSGAFRAFHGRISSISPPVMLVVY